MDSKMKKLVAGVALAGAMTVGMAGVAVAADGSSSTSDSATTTQPAETGRHPGLRLKVRRAVIAVVTDNLGVTRAELRDALQGGQTLTQYATSLGKDPQTLVDALTNAANTKLDQLVTDGTITQERADTVKSKLPARIDKLMNRQFGQHASA
ncbi:MAG TPA: hypothetical protein VK549_03050 [Acidimicrobiia bacterium]|nr:hypothetical protein [Acidimicrobiia bacterium]